MALFPPLSHGWLNGWIPIVAFYSSFLFLLKIFPKETVDRLYDNSGWTLEMARPAKIGLPFALVMIGFSLMVASWTILALLAVRIAMNHFWILGEEHALEDQYGDSYRTYKKNVPRYLLFL